ncbi:uncharacterized protein LOC105215005 isoform X2 [Zeugodacus cucurbitae]|uniref:uncharacterized protein LOC105215005 isoform X2 n=1 Tax=Zeugodacus cucurbitae TaxID=28588 RepID=UPI0023D931A0|nr:uncharacterized protein LOC105215005 isoform X2 [Zeugodacus cucurbitae]XP_054087335.1 uncharacterized protein LOC105215005 isoform X2 [Zeugodacus cucurbitae]
MSRKLLTRDDIADDLEKSSVDKVTGFSDDSFVDNDFEPDSESSDLESDNEDFEDSNEDTAMDLDEDPDEEVPPANLINSGTWGPVGGDRLTFVESPMCTGVNRDVAATLTGKSPADFFNYFISEDMINLFVTETNRFAAQHIIAVENSSNRSQTKRLAKWVDTDPSEMRTFLGIIIRWNSKSQSKTESSRSNKSNIKQTMER